MLSETSVRHKEMEKAEDKADLAPAKPNATGGSVGDESDVNKASTSSAAVLASTDPNRRTSMMMTTTATATATRTPSDSRRRGSIDSRFDIVTVPAEKNSQGVSQASTSYDLRPRRRMSRRYSSHQRNESAPDFLDDIDAADIQLAFPVEKTAGTAEDVQAAASRGHGHFRGASGSQSPSASAVFTIDGTEPVSKSSSEIRNKRSQHNRRRSESSDEWETGLRQALNVEVSKFKSEENLKKMKTTYKRALMPRGMLKVRGYTYIFYTYTRTIVSVAVTRIS